MRGKALTTRRQKHWALMELEASRRCSTCKRPLAEVTKVYEDFIVPGKFCSNGCLEEAQSRFGGRA